MFEHHPVAWMVGILVVCGIFFAVEKIRDLKAMRSQDPRPLPRAWKFHRSQGGGVVNSPHDMTEGEAIEWCSKNLGVIMFVDPDKGFIFYRPN